MKGYDNRILEHGASYYIRSPSSNRLVPYPIRFLLPHIRRIPQRKSTSKSRAIDSVTNELHTFMALPSR
jgi:hypothetical protein